MQVGGLRRQPVQRVSRGHALERPGCGKRIGAGTAPGEVEPDDRVPELAGAAGGAAVDPPAEHQPAAHARADRQHHQILGHELQVLVVGLGQRRHASRRCRRNRARRAARPAPGAAGRRRAARSPRRPPGRSRTRRSTAPRSPRPSSSVPARVVRRSSTSWSISASVLEQSVGCSSDSPSRRPAGPATATLVPPRSTPTTGCSQPRRRGGVEQHRDLLASGEQRRRDVRVGLCIRRRTRPRPRPPSPRPVTRNTTCRARRAPAG